MKKKLFSLLLIPCPIPEAIAGHAAADATRANNAAWQTGKK
jgi:hypothetical protein